MADDRQNDATDLDARIARAKSGQGVGAAVPLAKGYSQGSQVLATLLGALIGGGVLGWAVDSWMGTSPWGLLIILALAVIGAFMNIMKISKERAQ